MTQLPGWLVYGTAYAAIFSSVFVGIAGLIFAYLQLKHAKDQPKRDLEAHLRAIRMAKQERLLGDFAVILRHSIAQKTYMDLQMVVVPGKDPKEQEKQLLNYLYAESEGLSLAMARAR